MPARTALLFLTLAAASLLAPPTPAAAEGVAPVALAAGGAHTCLLIGGGEVLCWGRNDAGQLGDGTTADRHTPVAVSGLPGGVRSIAAGTDHTCAVLDDGSARCWGENGQGQLGDGTRDDRSTPVAVCAAVPCEAPLEPVAAVSGGDSHTCALLDGGSIRCWGENEDGQLGDGTTSDRLTPVEVGLPEPASAVAAGGFHTCMLALDGGAYCWGKNGEGQIGDDRACDPMTCPTASPVVGLDAGVEALAAAGLHNCALVDSLPWCWGLNFTGQLGIGTSGDISLHPVPTSGLMSGSVVAITADGAFTGHTCALLTSDEVWCWGHNATGQIGDGTTEHRTTPVAVAGLPAGVTLIEAGGAHTCAVAGGRVLCWGANSRGQLGDGTTDDRHTPVEVALAMVTAGDAGCDGTVNSIDAALVLQLVAQLLPRLACEKNADVNGDGTVNAIDAALILQFVAGLLPRLPP